jgi:hypothetical protein
MKGEVQRYATHPQVMLTNPANAGINDAYETDC